MRKIAALILLLAIYVPVLAGDVGTVPCTENCAASSNPLTNAVVQVVLAVITTR